MSLPSTPMVLPLGRGLNTHPDPRALGDGELAVARDVQFVPGGLITRYPYGSHSSTISNIRKLVPFGDELLAFTKDSLYSWSPATSTWISRGTYLAPKVTERSVFTRKTAQQLCDRAELSNVVVIVWRDGTAASTVAYIAAYDKTTRAVLLSPTSLGSSTTRPRLVVLSSVILLFYEDTGALVVKSITPSSIASFTAGSATTVQSAAQFDAMYDVAKLTSTSAIAVWRRDTNTSYGYATVSSALSVSASTKARTCDGPIAVDVSHNGSFVGIVRSNGVNVRGDVLNASLTDVDVDNALGSGAFAPDQVTFAWSETLSGSDLIGHAFWTAQEVQTAATAFLHETNTMDSAGNIGTADQLFRYRLTIASHAFRRSSASGGDGKVYIWGGFMARSSSTETALQRTYFLYRADGLLVAKACSNVAAGASTLDGFTPSVQDLGGDTYAWCGIEVRRVGEASTVYADPGPREIIVTFDSDESRRCVQHGKTLYIAGGGQVMQYDGEGLAEVGFHVYPWYLAVTDGGAGNMADGSYTWKATYAWENAQGEIDRSTTASLVTAALGGGNSDADVLSAPCHFTLKTSPRGEACWELWRTAINPGTDAPFYLATSQDPTATGSNGYVANAPTTGNFATFVDDLADATLITGETNPENGGILENLAPPPATIIVATEERLFLAGISDDPYAIWPSKLRGVGEVASFHDSLPFRVPEAGGEIRAAAVWQGVLVVFSERAIYAYEGPGPDNAGGGQPYGPARVIATDMGADSQEAVAVTPQGVLFRSAKGWHLLGGAGIPQYIGAPVEDFDSDTVESIDVMETDQHVRILTNNRMLVLDYSVSPPQWAEWTIASRVTSCVYGGVHYIATTGTVYQQQTSYTGIAYGMDIETAWIKMDSALGAKLLRRIHLLGEHRSAHNCRLRYAIDYQQSDASGITWIDDESWDSTPATVGGPLEVKFGPSRQRCKAFKLRITAYAAGSIIDPPSGEALRLTAIGIDVAFDRRLSRNLPVAQKV